MKQDVVDVVKSEGQVTNIQQSAFKFCRDSNHQILSTNHGMVCLTCFTILSVSNGHQLEIGKCGGIICAAKRCREKVNCVWSLQSVEVRPSISYSLSCKYNHISSPQYCVVCQYIYYNLD